MIHFKYMGETIIEDDIQNGDWLLMSYNKTYYFNREEFRDYCKEAHWDYLREITTIEIDEDRNRFVWIEWSELDDSDLDSQSYNINNIFRRLGQKEDPWKGMMNHAYSLAGAQEKLDKEAR